MYRVILIVTFISLIIPGCGHDRNSPKVSRDPIPGKEKVERTVNSKQHTTPPETSPSSQLRNIAQLNLKWPRAVNKAALSPDGKSLAILDAKGVYIADQKGGNATKLKISMESGTANEYFDMAFSYNPQSTRLAVFTTSSYGEPGVCENDKLYWVDINSHKTQIVGEWHECIQGNGTAVVGRELKGWSSDGDSIKMQAEIWQGEGMPGADSVTSKSTRNVSFDVTQPKTWNRGALTSQLSW